MRHIKKPTLRSIAIRLLLACLLSAGISVSSHPTAHAADTNVNVSVCSATPYPAPVVTEPQDGFTTASSVLMQGTASPNIPVYAYRNGTQVGFVSSSGSGEFAISISLDMGSNALSASTNNDCGAPAFSNTVTVTRQAPPTPEQPAPSTSSPGTDTSTSSSQPSSATPGQSSTPADTTPSGPADTPAAPGQGTAPILVSPDKDTEVSDPFLIVTGRAAARTKVTIWRDSDRLAEVTSDDTGLFQAGITLQQGKNRITAAVGSGDSLLRSPPVTITYTPKKPTPDIKTIAKQAAIVLLVAASVSVGVYLAAHTTVGIEIRRLLKVRFRR